MKYVVYYRVAGGVKVNRDYPDYLFGTDVKTAWQTANRTRVYLQHEPHDEYVVAFAPYVGADESIQRGWLADRVNDLNQQAKAMQIAKQAKLIPGTGTGYGGAKPGDIVRDQHGRSGRVPQVELEVFRTKPIDPDKAMEAVRQASKGV